MYKMLIAALMLLTFTLVAQAAQKAAPEATAPLQRVEYKRYVPGGAFTTTSGEQLYQEACQVCHMAGGKGASGGVAMYPELAKNPMLTSPQSTAFVVVHGLRGMPSFANMLNDAQTAAVVNYVCNNFGNKSKKKLTPEEVKTLRQAE